VAGLCVLAALGSALAGPAARRRGQVVRVERPRARPADPVRLCIITNPGEGKMVCYGRSPPEVGAQFTVLDDAGLRGRVTAGEARRADSYDGCQLGSAHEVDMVLGELDLGLAPYFYQMAIQGVALERGARLLRDLQVGSPSGRDSEQVWAWLDRDGDGEVDLLGTAFDCSSEERSLPPAPPGQTVVPLCLDYWMRDRAEWTRVGRDVFLQCH
jgi:hypothetical protein